MRNYAFGIVLAMCLSVPMITRAQSRGVPVPSPFPGAGSPPSSTGSRPPAPPPRAPDSPAPATPAPPAGAAAASAPVGPQLSGVPAVYPAAEYLESIDAGSGQHYYLYGTEAPFSDIVAYYRTVMRNGGREIYDTPGIHQFELGRFEENRMVYPPSVVVKDYSSSPGRGYLHVDGTTEKRFRTIIQVVPPEVR